MLSLVNRVYHYGDSGFVVKEMSGRIPKAVVLSSSTFKVRVGRGLDAYAVGEADFLGFMGR
jgi:hypothetical protein